MKKIKYLFFLILTIFICNKNVYASGGLNLSKSNVSINIGSQASITVSANNCGGKVEVNSTDSSIASVSGETNKFLDSSSSDEKKLSFTIKANKEGNTTINVKATDLATFDNEDLSGKVYTISVTVTNQSTNAKISSISVVGHDLTKIDDNNYSLIVDNDINDVTIEATPEDNKTQITGTGTFKLNNGDNLFEVVAISESGTRNVIKITVTKKDAYYLEDIDKLLTNSTDSIDIKIFQDTIISTEILNKIKNSNKVVNFNYYDENQKLIYTWKVDSKEIDLTDPITTLINFESSDKTKIDELSNYADIKYLHFGHSGKLPSGITIKLYVGDKYVNDEYINFYYYNSFDNKIELINKGLKVTDGYIEFSIDHCSEYFVTKSLISNSVLKTKEGSNNNFIEIIELIIIIVLIIILIITYIINKKNNKKNSNNDVNENKDISSNLINNQDLNENITEVDNSDLLNSTNNSIIDNNSINNANTLNSDFQNINNN